MKRQRRCEIANSIPKTSWSDILNGWREQRDEREVIVTGDDIMHIVSKWTGVPLSRMEQKETQKTPQNGGGTENSESSAKTRR